MKWTVFTLFCVFLVSCGGGTEELADTYDRDEFFVVDYEAILENPEMVLLSDLASDIEYIRLETDDDCLLCLKPDFYFTDNFIFVDNSKHILQFDRQGNFIKQIGKHGRGPGEIGLIRQLSVLEDQELLIAQTNWARKLYYFNYEGEFLSQREVPDMYRIIGLPDSSFLHFNSCIDGKTEYMFTLINRQGDTTGVVNNHYKWDNTIGYGASVSYDLFRPFYKYEDASYFKSRHNDTIYKAVEGAIIPAYFIDMGKFMLPQEYRVEALKTSPATRFQDFKELSSGYRFVSALEAKDNLFLSSRDYQNFQDNGVQYKMIYSREGDSGSLMVDESGFSSGLINDIDGGPDFWPIGALNDSTIFMSLMPHEILALVPMETKAMNGTENTQLSNLKEILNIINEDDNPVLMLVHLKGE